MSFSYEDYNELVGINEAHVKLRKQLDSTGTGAKLQDLITDPAITKLLHDSDYQFGICILHRHALLEPGERMVSSVLPLNPLEPLAPPVSIAKPSTDMSSKICADRWMRNGDEFEHTIPSDGNLISPPPPEFFEVFQDVCDEYNVDVLGICTANLDFFPHEDQVYLELPFGDKKLRAQKTTLVWRKDVEHLDARQSAWVPVRPRPSIKAFTAENSVTETLSTMLCSHTCGHTRRTDVGGEDRIYSRHPSYSDRRDHFCLNTQHKDPVDEPQHQNAQMDGRRMLRGGEQC